MQSAVVEEITEPEANIPGVRESRQQEALVAAAKKGDELAFTTLVKHNQPKILAVALRYTHTRQDAEDVVQQSFQKAFVHLHEFQQKSSFSTWLTGIAVNEALMWLRRGRGQREISLEDDSIALKGATSRHEIPDSGQDPEARFMQRERARILSIAIDELGPGTRRAIELRELGELSTKETARCMGLSESTVKGRLFHARRKLREKLSLYLRGGPKSPTSSATSEVAR